MNFNETLRISKISTLNSHPIFVSNRSIFAKRIVFSIISHTLSVVGRNEQIEEKIAGAVN